MIFGRDWAIGLSVAATAAVKVQRLPHYHKIDYLIHFLTYCHSFSLSLSLSLSLSVSLSVAQCFSQSLF